MADWVTGKVTKVQNWSAPTPMLTRPIIPIWSFTWSPSPMAN